MGIEEGGARVLPFIAPSPHKKSCMDHSTAKLDLIDPREGRPFFVDVHVVPQPDGTYRTHMGPCQDCGWEVWDPDPLTFAGHQCVHCEAKFHIQNLPQEELMGEDWRKPPDYELRSSDLASIPDLDYDTMEVIPRLAYRDSLTLLYGEPSGGKSTLCRIAIARMLKGLDWLTETPVKPARVLWVGEETLPLVKADMELFGIRDSENFRALYMSDAPDLNSLKLEVANFSADVVVLDTLVDFLNLKDDRNQSAIRSAMRALRLPGCATIGLHHTPKGDPSNPIGAQAFRGTPDLVIGMVKTKEKTVRGLTVNKARSAIARFGVEQDRWWYIGKRATVFEEVARPVSEGKPSKPAAKKATRSSKPLPKEVIEYILDNPNASVNQVCKKFGIGRGSTSARYNQVKNLVNG